MNNKKYLIDTNIIIDYLKDKSSAVNFLENMNIPPVLSVMTVAELYSGVKENEKDKMKEFLKAYNIINVNYDIAKQGGFYRNQYHKSHGVCLTDGIIAATAKLNNYWLATLNTKHFPMIKDIFRPY